MFSLNLVKTLLNSNKMAKVYVVTSSKAFGEGIVAFNNLDSANTYILNNPTNQYRCHEFASLGVPTIYVSTCENSYGESVDFPIAIFTSYSDAINYGMQKWTITNSQYSTCEVSIK